MHLDITTRDYKTLKYLLNAYLPGTTVWAFGSRVKFTSKPESDLDLVAFIQSGQESELAELKDAFAESDLPFKVDILDWSVIPDNFKLNIQKEYVQLQDTETQNAEIPPNWKPYKLGEFASINPRVLLKQEYEYSFVEMKDLAPSFKYVSPSVKRKFKGGSKFNNGDTLFARITPCLENGKISQVKNLQNGVGFGSTEFMVFRGKENLSDNDFVYYLTRSDNVRNRAIQAMTGTSGRQRVEKTALENIEIVAPDLQVQQSIANIISSLDDKIELNQQMNQTLEGIAQTIFKEWFVNFNFPGFDGKLLNGLPKNWGKQKLGESLITILGGTPSTTNKAFWENGNIAWINSSKVNEFRIIEPSNYISEEALKKSNAKLLPTKTTVLAITGATLGQVSRLEVSSAANQSVVGILENERIKSEFIYLWIKHKIKDIIKGQTGGAQQHINKADINNTDLLIPENKVLEQFQNAVRDIFEKISINCFENKNLISLRDSILPRLMTGKMEVKA